MKPTLDEFTRAYITTALWSSTDYKFAECPCCGEERLLSHYPGEEYEQEPMCYECAETETQAEPDPLDSNYSVNDLAPETLAKVIADCQKFQEENANTIAEALATGELRYGSDFCLMGRSGHDFWLTRCGHGGGFWDGGWPEPYSDKLTKAAKAFGNVDLYVGDDGKIYC